MTTETSIIDQRTYDERGHDFMEKVGRHADLYTLQRSEALDLGREYLGFMSKGILEMMDERMQSPGMQRASEERIVEFDQMMEESISGDNRKLKHFLLQKGILYNKQAIAIPNNERMKTLGKACYAIGFAMPAVNK